MKNRFRLVRRGTRGGTFYFYDRKTRKRSSLGTSDPDAAAEIVAAKNNAERQPMLNLQLARAYLQGSDSTMNKRTWADALESLIQTKQGANKLRWQVFQKDKAIIPLASKIVVQTEAEAILAVLRQGTVSTNVFLRRLHNFCVDMNWLPWPLVPKRQWPAVRFKEKRAISWEEHAKIVEREGNPERKAFYQLAWHLGASQSDLAHLHAEDIDWGTRVISFFRMKTRWRGQQPPQIRFGTEVEEILAGLPKSGPLFPYLITVRCADRATEFRQRCTGLGIHGVSLHSYRYAWAERAKSCGYPERFAQLALGHNSKAVHRAYARKAMVVVPSLEDFEKQANALLQFPTATVPAMSGVPAAASGR